MGVSELPFSPDFFAVNGNSARKHFEDFNYPTDKVIELEALRYMNLGSLSDNKKGILILGNIVKKKTLEMLNIILPITRGLNKKIYFKSHLAQSIYIDKIQYPNINITDLNLDKLLNQFDTVICCSSSGAAVESFVLNLKTIVFVPLGDLNQSPLKNIPNVFFVSSCLTGSGCFGICPDGSAWFLTGYLVPESGMGGTSRDSRK